MEKNTEEKTTREKLENKKYNLKQWIIALIVILIIESILLGLFYFVFQQAQDAIGHKPIIYIYPEQEMQVTVSVSNPEKFTTVYPKYENNWQVLAKPSGDLVDLKTGRNLYALYWEGKDYTHSDMSKGFVVKGEDTASFLEEKLEILGLNDREAEEFIIYWLPKMEHNPYNYIYFQTMEEINNYMELNITPKPETLIRVMMEFKGLNKPIEIKEQELEKIERKGYTVVEWGGTEIK